MTNQPASTDTLRLNDYPANGDMTITPLQAVAIFIVLAGAEDRAPHLQPEKSVEEFRALWEDFCTEISQRSGVNANRLLRLAEKMEQIAWVWKYCDGWRSQGPDVRVRPLVTHLGQGRRAVSLALTWNSKDHRRYVEISLSPEQQPVCRLQWMCNSGKSSPYLSALFSLQALQLPKLNK